MLRIVWVSSAILLSNKKEKGKKIRFSEKQTYKKADKSVGVLYSRDKTCIFQILWINKWNFYNFSDFDIDPENYKLKIFNFSIFPQEQ